MYSSALQIPSFISLILRDHVARHGSVAAGLKAYVGAALLPDDGGYAAKIFAEQDRFASVALGLANCGTANQHLCKPAVKKSTKTYSDQPKALAQTDSRTKNFLDAGAAGPIEEISAHDFYEQAQ